MNTELLQDCVDFFDSNYAEKSDLLIKCHNKFYNVDEKRKGTWSVLLTVQTHDKAGMFLEFDESEHALSEAKINFASRNSRSFSFARIKSVEQFKTIVADYIQ